MKIKKICVVTPNYPLNGFPERGVFVANLVDKWQKSKIIVDVIAPVSYPVYFRSLKRRSLDFVFPPANKLMEPKFFSMSGVFSDLEKKSFINSVVKSARKLDIPDLYYGKFLFSGAKAASILAKNVGKPIVADLGESKLLELLKEDERKEARELIANLSGVVVVSERLKKEIIQLGMDENKILLSPNGVELKQFKKLNKEECRKKLSLPEKKFIVIFVGHFIDRKGPLKVLKAIEKINNPEIVGVFLGKGTQVPSGKHVLKAGSVNHNELHLWLNASDVFVLPTLAEGNCNAINEAMACGLPIISSDIDDVKVQVNVKNSILVDPNNIDEISLAINEIYKNKEKRKMMSFSSLEIAKTLSLEMRAKKILKWMEEIVS